MAELSESSEYKPIILTFDEPNSVSAAKWFTWTSIIIIVVLLLIYFSNYFAAGADSYNSAEKEVALYKLRMKKTLEKAIRSDDNDEFQKVLDEEMLPRGVDGIPCPCCKEKYEDAINW